MLILTLDITLVGKVLGVVLAFFGLVVIGGVAWYTFKAQRQKVRSDQAREKSDAAQEWRDVANAQNEKLALVTEGLGRCRAEHDKCQAKINLITMFNLRLQARETRYQKTINRLERRLGLEPTDFLDVAAPEDSAFG